MIEKKSDKVKKIKKSSSKKVRSKTIFNNKLLYTSVVVIMKVLLISLVIYGLYEKDSSFSNTVSLLAVSENGEGEIVSGSVIDLSLIVKPGSGNIYVNQNALVEIDTQISVTDSNKIACNIFKLDCSSYDFFYEFDSSSLVLKGPSASSAIAILTAKTLNFEKIKTDEVTITGSLNSGGIIGVVGGVDKKIETALAHRFTKVLVPAFSDFNKTKEYPEISVIRSVDIIDAYNEFNGDNYELNIEKVESSEYQLLMKKLSDDMCARGYDLNLSVDFSLIKENTTNSKLINNSLNSLNDSLVADLKGNYYSMGSYCYNMNLNLMRVFENQKNLSLENRDYEIKLLKEKIDNTLELFESKEYKKNIQTMNDFYVYLILIDRTYEAKDLVEAAENLKVNLSKFEVYNESSNKSILKVNSSFISSLEKSIVLQKENLFSFSNERLYTVSLWEKFIDHSGKNISFSELEVSNVCDKINREISIKNELLENYELDVFDEIISEQLMYNGRSENKYLCIYKGLELDGRINTVLNTAGISSNEEAEFVNKFIELTTTRINLNSQGSFPFIPTIYSEYSGDLISQGDIGSGLLYSNYAMSYSNLNLYLEKDFEENIKFTEIYFDKLFENLFFVVTILVVIAFMN